jgi:type IV pilus assembly protein PilV
MRLIPPPRPHDSAGFTLVEVLVTIFVTAVGLLTVAGLQAASKKVGYETAQRTAAAALAQDMVERIRAVSSNALVSDANKATYLGNILTDDATAITSSTDCASSVCTLSQLAGWDLRQWGQKLLGNEEKIGSDAVGGLISPTGCVKKIGSKYRVVVAWRSFNNTQTKLASTEDGNDDCGSTKDAYRDPDSGTADAVRQYIVIEFV